MNLSQILRRCVSFRFGILLLFVLSGFIYTAAQSPAPSPALYFEDVLEKRLSANDLALEKFCPVSTDIIATRVLQSYGSIFVASDAVKLPGSCVAKGESEVRKFQKNLDKKVLEINGFQIELQAAAAAALEISVGEAVAEGYSITPLDGEIAGARSYGDTLMLWNSRVFPALEFWVRRGRLSPDARDEIGRLDLKKKIEKIIEWEAEGIYFGSDRARSILTSTAPPGTSQHLYLAAFDVTEFWNAQVRSILNRNGWFQTVIDDPPHFTYLGFPETELPSRGLVAVAKGGHRYWVPNLQPRPVPTN
ncbi:MAG TPA: hypothetical protein VMZ26_15410 [Pyrinomonadaceae bacterium]|nr:hypothetical protein [Pyrinomonadaceae bacterium]